MGIETIIGVPASIGWTGEVIEFVSILQDLNMSFFIAV